MAEKWEEMPGNGHLKRHRAPTSGCQNVSCLVDGCRNDLSQCRDYHRRHKVCESHSKTPIVLVGGQEQRFCQQCSRFHLLIEFDDVKRSCRKRLDGHNRRRRKPISGNLLLNHHGAKLPNCAQMFPTPSTDSNCCTTVKGEDEALSSRQLALSNTVQPHPSQQCGSPSTWSFREGRQFPFLHRIDPAISSASESRFSHSLDSDCALSLLSSSAQTQANMLSTLEYGNELSLDTMEADLRILHSEGDGGASSQSHLPFSWY